LFLFFLLPRVSAGYLGKTSFNPTLLSGFTDQVELGQIGEIKKSSAVVLRVETGSPVNYPALRWRGNALANFDGRRWTSAERSSETLSATVTAGSHYVTNRNLANCAEKFCNSPCCRSRWHPMRSSSPGTLWQFAEFTGETGGVSHRRSYLYRDSAGSLINPFHNFVSVRYTGISQLPALDRPRLAAAGSDYPAAITDMYLQLPSEIDPRIAALARSATEHSPRPMTKPLSSNIF